LGVELLLWFLIISIFLLIILFSNVYIIFEFEETLVFKIRFLFLNFKVFPAKNSKKTLKKSKSSSKKKSTSKQDIKSRRENSISFFAKLFRVIFKIICKIWNKTKINKLFLNISISTGDAASTAVLYGQACAVFYPLYQLILKNKDKTNSQISIYPNFKSQKTQINFYTKLSFRLFYLLSIIFKNFGSYIKAQNS
jgi:hypothetical protein